MTPLKRVHIPGKPRAYAPLWGQKQLKNRDDTINKACFTGIFPPLSNSPSPFFSGAYI